MAFEVGPVEIRNPGIDIRHPCPVDQSATLMQKLQLGYEQSGTGRNETSYRNCETGAGDMRAPPGDGGGGLGTRTSNPKNLEKKKKGVKYLPRTGYQSTIPNEHQQRYAAVVTLCPPREHTLRTASVYVVRGALLFNCTDRPYSNAFRDGDV
jgi:hypothetical protein